MVRVSGDACGGGAAYGGEETAEGLEERWHLAVSQALAWVSAPAQAGRGVGGPVSRRLPRDCQIVTGAGRRCDAPTRYELAGYSEGQVLFVACCSVHLARCEAYLATQGTWSRIDRRAMRATPVA